MYEWTLWFHIISFISWFSALFYLPRLFVYHMENIQNSGFVEVVKIQEMKLFKYIGVPAMWATIISGSFLIYQIGFSGGWLHVKLFFILLCNLFLSIFLKFNISNCSICNGFAKCIFAPSFKLKIFCVASFKSGILLYSACNET